MKDELVLCVHKSQTNKPVQEISKYYFGWLNRKLVDSSNFLGLAQEMLQVIPLMLIKCENKFLVFKRQGTEARLHNQYSLTVGGHISDEDWDMFRINPMEAIKTGMCRESLEELGLYISPNKMDFKYKIYSTKDEVSSVHIGLIGVVEIASIKDLKPQEEELGKITWMDVGQLNTLHDSFENWSQIIIKEILWAL